MDWQVLIIPLIALAVYILGSLLGGKKEPPPAPRRPQGGGRGGEPVRGSRRPSELDRFLQEVQRRRQIAEERAGPKPEEVPSADAERRKPVPPPPPRPRTAERSRAAQVRPVVISTPPPPPVEERPVNAPFQKLAVEIQPTAAVLAAPASPATPEPPALLVLPTAPVVQRLPSAKPPPAALAQVCSLLRSPQTLATAVLLQEVLGPPRSQRTGVRRPTAPAV